MSYQLPDAATLAAAIDTAQAQREAAPSYHARVMCTVTAAAVRDILTDFDPQAPFDAVALELTHRRGEFGVSATGTYWTADDSEQHITEPMDLHGLSEWICELTTLNRSGWQPLCTPARGTAIEQRFRLDLERAAELPTDADLAAAQHGQTPGYLAITDAISTGGPGIVCLTIRYSHQGHLTEASAQLVYPGHSRADGFQEDAFITVTELAATALKQGAATLELTTEHPGGFTQTVQRLKFTAEHGAEVEARYSEAAPSPY